MTKLRYRPYWLDRIPKARRPTHEPFRGELDVEVAIVGGGLVGCVAAYWFAAAGVRVAVLEAQSVGEGGTARSSGALSHEPQASFIQVVDAYGLRAGRRIWETSRRSGLELTALLRRQRIRCDLQAADVIEVARTPGETASLRRERDARRDAGLEVSWLPGPLARRTTRTDAEGGTRAKGGAAIDPYRAATGAAAAAVRRGAAVYQDSPVVRVRPGRKTIEITTARGLVRAQTAVMTTGVPDRGFEPLRRHFRAMESYAVLTPPLNAALRKETAAGAWMVRDLQDPPHWLRRTRDDRILFSGADQPQPPPRNAEKTLIQRTGQLMYELSLMYPVLSGIQPEYSWASGYGLTADGLPVIGPHRNYPRHLFALGFGVHSLGLASLAGRLMVRHYLGSPAKGDELFGFERLLGG